MQKAGDMFMNISCSYHTKNKLFPGVYTPTAWTLKKKDLGYKTIETNFRVLAKYTRFLYVYKDSHFRLRYACWTPRHNIHKITILNLSGMGSYIERHMEIIYDLINLGYEVWAFDFTGQGGSSPTIAHPQCVYIRDFSIYMDDVSIMIELIRRENKMPILLIGGSMGGHIALRYVAEHPTKSICGVFTVCAMISLYKRTLAYHCCKILIYILVMFGLGKIPVSLHVATMDGFLGRFSHYFIKALFFIMALVMPGKMPKHITEKKDNTISFENNRVTSDKNRFEYLKKSVKEHARGLGRDIVTLGWIASALASIDILHNPQYLKKIETPVYGVLAGKDQHVYHADNQAVFKNISNHTLVTYEGSYHGIIYEKDAIRDRIFFDLEAFVISKVRAYVKAKKFLS